MLLFFMKIMATATKMDLPAGPVMIDCMTSIRSSSTLKNTEDPTTLFYYKNIITDVLELYDLTNDFFANNNNS